VVVVLLRRRPRLILPGMVPSSVCFLGVDAIASSVAPALVVLGVVVVVLVLVVVVRMMVVDQRGHVPPKQRIRSP
jgi:hypothetical protein